jgi:hypothetical protein
MKTELEVLFWDWGEPLGLCLAFNLAIGWQDVRASRLAAAFKTPAAGCSCQRCNGSPQEANGRPAG